jgi:nitroreductase
VRAFKKQPVESKVLGLILHSATHAPSAGNIQEWRFVVIKDEKKKSELAEAAFKQNFISKAPVCIIVAADLEEISLKYGKRGEMLYALQDTANASMLMMLAAHALGLAACWVGSFDEDKVSHVAELPQNLRPLVILVLGYPAEEPKEHDRRPFENYTSLNSYGKKSDIAYAVQPQPGKETRIRPIGNIFEDLIRDASKRLKRATFSYKNSKGQTFWLHAKEGRGGTTLLFFNRNSRGAMDLPEEMEVVESDRNHLPIAKKRKTA